MGAGTYSARWRQRYVVIATTDSWQAEADAAPNGTRFRIAAGVHRMQNVDPNDYQAFIGEDGAIMNGAEVITAFTQENGLWVISGQTQEGWRNGTGFPDQGAERAGYPETLFIDNVPLRPVDALGKVVPGRFFFDYDADKIYFADNPSGRTVEVGKVDEAIGSDFAVGVTVKNLIVEKYNCPTQFGAIHGGGANWIIQDNEVRLNYAVGIYSKANSIVTGNYVHDNGQMGIGGSGNDILIERNEIASNGSWSGIDPGWEGGGSKWAETDRLIVRNNYSHDNHGYGLWTDVYNINSLYEGNIVVNNLDAGIVHEISYAATIRNNVLIGNGKNPDLDWMWGCAILIQNSRNVEVHGNQIDSTGGGNGIGLVQQARGGTVEVPAIGTGPHGDFTTTGNNVHHNVMVAMTPDDGFFGAVADFDPAGMKSGGNIFDHNEYHVTSASDDHWAWEFFYTWDDWRTQTGFEVNGTVSTTPRTIVQPTF